MDRENQSYFLKSLKRKMYLFLLPFLIIAMTLGWLLDGLHDTKNFVNHTIFPLLDLWFVAALLLLIFRDRYLRQVELITFVLVTIIYLSWFADLVFNRTDQTFTNGGLGEFTNWVPLFYLYIALIFNRRKALITSIVIFILSVLLGFASFPGSDHAYIIRASDTLIQFYLSNAAYILALYFLQHLKEAFIQKETLRQMANTDFLTGLPNRRLLEEAVDANLKTNTPFSIILFDIDLFKETNDKFGHDIGDLVLRKFTELVKENTRESDTFGRWGGEEFLVIANHQNATQALHLAERLRNIVATHHFYKVGSVTASFGVAEYQQGEAKDSLLKHSDIALYHAKEKGRNQVQAYEIKEKHT